MLCNARAQDSWAEMETGGGIAGNVLLATPMGMCPLGRLRAGDVVRAATGGPLSVVSLTAATGMGWMRIAPLALGNRHAVTVGMGQGVLIESSFAQRMVGSAAVVVPALALRHWRGVAPCAAPASCLRITASRPALVVGSTGLLFAVNGPANSALPLAAQGSPSLPPVPSLSLASAQQLIACLIAQEAGAMLRGLRPYAAVF